VNRVWIPLLALLSAAGGCGGEGGPGTVGDVPVRDPELQVTAGIGEAGHARLRRLLPSAAFVPVDGDRFHVPTLEFPARVAELEALLAPVAPAPLCTDPASTAPR